MEKPKHSAAFEPPDLAPVIVTEHTPHGWRGLTEDGEILNVTAHVNGSPSTIPESLGMTNGGEFIGYRKVEQVPTPGVIDAYLQHLNESMRLTRLNENERALEEVSLAMTLADTALVRFNRAMIALQLGYFFHGFNEFARVERESNLFMRPNFRKAIEAGCEPWRGQNLNGKSILLTHDHGFGDTIMCLRYVPALKDMGARVTVQCPAELESIVRQHAPSVRDTHRTDYVCSMLFLMQVLQEYPGEWYAPYVRVDQTLVEKWRATLRPERKYIGVACSVGKNSSGDFPRECPQAFFDIHLSNEADLISVQQERLVNYGVSKFEDFADCAALMSLMDEIVTVDTAAVHLAGAIGHPNITLLLSKWHSWRWKMPLYPSMKICVQKSDGDWDSAFAQRQSFALQGQT